MTFKSNMVAFYLDSSSVAIWNSLKCHNVKLKNNMQIALSVLHRVSSIITFLKSIKWKIITVDKKY